LEEGNVADLENLVLEGQAHRIIGKKSSNETTNAFLEIIPKYQAKIDALHKAVEDGDIRRADTLIDHSYMALARDKYGITPIHKAVLFGQTNTVSYLLAKHPLCVNVIDEDGRTPLHYAAADPLGKFIAKLLQKSGANAFIEDKYGHTPFYYRSHVMRSKNFKENTVISQLISGQMNRKRLRDLEEDISDWIHVGNIAKMEQIVLFGYGDLLLGRMNEVEDSDVINFLEVLPQYQTKIQAAHKAVEKADLKYVKLLIDRKKMSLCRDSRRLTPLHKAIIFGHIKIIKYLVRYYPQAINAMDEYQRTALHYAAALRDGGFIYKILRKAGGDPNIVDCRGCPAKFYLKFVGEIDFQSLKLDAKEAFEQMLQNKITPSFLEYGIQQWLRDGNIGKLDQLVISGCGDLLLNRASTNPSASDFLKNLPKTLDEINFVHKSIKEGDLEKLKNIMKTKKLALSRNRYGCTPLHTAIIYERTEIVRYIASNFPSVINSPDYNERTPMHYAAASCDGGHYMKILSKAGGDIKATDKEGRTPDYYQNHNVINLKMLRGRRDSIQYEQFEQTPCFDSVKSPRSSSNDSYSDVDSQSDTNNSQDQQQTASDENLPTSDSGIYLARTVAPALTKALTEVLVHRPADPIGFITDWLLTKHEADKLE
uniref:ANK_REP_REGION domain-containing protein n=1 Tax=Dracunculus medinensis TaxID=318479 RepID=A0A0N4U7Y3_DRAME